MNNETTKETKLCKHCQSEIPKKAKVCPNCRKKQNKSILGVFFLVIGILIFLGALGSSLDSGDEPKKVNNDVSKRESETVNIEQPDESDTFSVGDTAEMKDIQVAFLDYEESEGSQFNKPTNGNVYVLANFEIINNSKSEITISSMLGFKAYADDYSLNYSLGAMMEKTNASLDGTIAPGKKMNGWIGYELPSDWKNLEIHFTHDVWSSDEFVFVIEK